MNAVHIKAKIDAWLTSFIIQYNICPFAKKVYENNSIHFEIIETKNTADCLEAVFLECQRLDTDVKIETTLIIYPDHFYLFDAYLDFLAMAESLLIEQGYEGIYQLASFHPDYCFDGESPSDPANFTNRSPYPMIHLIRESSLANALKTFPHPELIPQRNIELTRKMGLKKIQDIFNKVKGKNT